MMPDQNPRIGGERQLRCLESAFAFRQPDVSSACRSPDHQFVLVLQCARSRLQRTVAALTLTSPFNRIEAWAVT
jgi:hypothetical protein